MVEPGLWQSKATVQEMNIPGMPPQYATKMKQEIEALEKETGQPPEIEEVSKQLIDARASLATSSERLGKEHPDVVQGRRTIEFLEQEVRRLGSDPLRKHKLRPENPAYINLQAQLNSATSSLNALRTTRAAVKRRLENYATRLERTPEMEPDYLFLTRDRDTSGQKYQDIRSRLLEAKVSEGLEVQRKGERCKDRSGRTTQGRNAAWRGRRADGDTA